MSDEDDEKRPLSPAQPAKMKGVRPGGKRAPPRPILGSTGPHELQHLEASVSPATSSDSGIHWEVPDHRDGSTMLPVGYRQHNPHLDKQAQRTKMCLIITTIACLCIVAFASITIEPGLPSDPLARAHVLHALYPMIDGHNDFPWAIRELNKTQVTAVPVMDGNDLYMTSAMRMRKGRVGAQFWSVYVDCDAMGADAVRKTMQQIDIVHRLTEEYPEMFAIAHTADDITRLHREGKVASLMGVEGGHQIDESMAVLRNYYRLGVRYMTLTHSCNTQWAESCVMAASTQGLSPFGRQVVREMNRIGMLVDLSHVSPATMHAALDETRVPVIFSHSSVRSLADVPRNVPDDVLARVKTNGGVVMVNFYPAFVKPCIHSPCEPVSLADVVDHIMYIADSIGWQHVGYGSDFDGIPTVPVGLEDPSKYVELTAELIRQGFSDEAVRGIIGGNVLRVLREAEQYAESRVGIEHASEATLPRATTAQRHCSTSTY